ncbi:hypothetical protein [Microcoleus sp. Pol10D4]|uniref:hypothetical protein n=1 Tax=Microcoleus sp. Pol10D4 TaxID=3055387 RepID=UPI002FD08998
MPTAPTVQPCLWCCCSRASLGRRVINPKTLYTPLDGCILPPCQRCECECQSIALLPRSHPIALLNLAI